MRCCQSTTVDGITSVRMHVDRAYAHAAAIRSARRTVHDADVRCVARTLSGTISPPYRVGSAVDGGSRSQGAVNNAIALGLLRLAASCSPQRWVLTELGVSAIASIHATTVTDSERNAESFLARLTAEPH